MSVEKENWTTIITPKNSFFRLNLNELWQYRDLVHLVGFAVQLWMYATPIVYPLSMVPEKWRSIYVLNPVVPILESFKHAFFSTGMPSVPEYGISIATTVFLLFAGIFVFNLVEKNFVDTV